MLAIHPRLRIVALEHAMRRGHLRRLVIGHIALDLCLGFPLFGFFYRQELVQAFHLMQQTLFLLLASGSLRTRQPVLLQMFRDHLMEFGLQLVPFLL